LPFVSPSRSFSPVPGLTQLTVLARGGFATVYRAHQESVGRDVALKIDNRTLDNERDRKRFMREARAAGRMSGHPHVVDLFDAGVTAEGHPYLVMELCQTSYSQRLREHGPLPVEEVQDVGVKIADALAAAHREGVLHRDVKPANILLHYYGSPVLADFGLAVLDDMHRLSPATLDVLTPAYAPPEAFRSEPPTQAGDVYSLAATLYALLHGRPPRWPAEGTPSLVEMLALHQQPVPDLPGVPPRIMNALRAGLAEDPAQRPTAEWLRDELAAASGVIVPTLLPRSEPTATLPLSGTSSVQEPTQQVSPQVTPQTQVSSQAPPHTPLPPSVPPTQAMAPPPRRPSAPPHQPRPVSTFTPSVPPAPPPPPFTDPVPPAPPPAPPAYWTYPDLENNWRKRVMAALSSLLSMMRNNRRA